MSYGLAGWIRRNLANLITFARLSLCLALFWLIFAHRDRSGTIFILVLVALLSDAVDGEVARRMKIVSRFGAAFDRIVDKLFLGIMFYFFLSDQRVDLLLKTIIIPLAIVEVLLLALWMAGVAKNMDVSASLWGKRKMIFLAVGIVAGMAKILIEEGWSTEAPNCTVPFLFLIFEASLVFAVMSLKTHFGKYRSQLPCS